MKRSILFLAPLALAMLVAAPIPSFAADVDGDGFASPGPDCDDNNSAVHPGAFEIVGDSIDEDCNAQEQCFGDMDDDGARVAGAVLSSDTDCFDAYEGRVSDPLDCDDNDPAVSPLASEVCDASNVDEDCDGSADDDDAGGATGKTSWYQDSDTDSYGNGSVSQLRCDSTPGYVASSGDCNDANGSVYPGATEAVGDDVDQNCDNQELCFTDSDDDGARLTTWAASADTDCDDAAEGKVADSLDCDDDDGDVYPNGNETCVSGDPKDYDCDGFAGCADTDSCAAAPGCTTEVFDHLECFKIKTTEKLKATLDVDPGDNPPFELAAGCTIGKATKFCVPVMKTVTVVDASSSLVDNPLYEGDPLTNERICYKVKCPDMTDPGTVTVRDRFGFRNFQKFKVSELCTAAEIVP